MSAYGYGTAPYGYGVAPNAYGAAPYGMAPGPLGYGGGYGGVWGNGYAFGQPYGYGYGNAPYQLMPPTAPWPAVSPISSTSSAVTAIGIWPEEGAAVARGAYLQVEFRPRDAAVWAEFVVDGIPRIVDGNLPFEATLDLTPGQYTIIVYVLTESGELVSAKRSLIVDEPLATIADTPEVGCALQATSPRALPLLLVLVVLAATRRRRHKPR